MKATTLTNTDNRPKTKQTHEKQTNRPKNHNRRQHWDKRSASAPEEYEKNKSVRVVIYSVNVVYGGVLPLYTVRQWAHSFIPPIPQGAPLWWGYTTLYKYSEPISNTPVHWGKQNNSKNRPPDGWKRTQEEQTNTTKNQTHSLQPPTLRENV